MQVCFAQIEAAFEWLTMQAILRLLTKGDTEILFYEVFHCLLSTNEKCWSCCAVPGARYRGSSFVDSCGPSGRWSTSTNKEETQSKVKSSETNRVRWINTVWDVPCRRITRNNRLVQTRRIRSFCFENRICRIQSFQTRRIDAASKVTLTYFTWYHIHK